MKTITLDERTADVETPHDFKHELAVLAPILGRWRVEGTNKSSIAHSADAPVTGKEIHERMPGEFFIHSCWSHRFEDGRHDGVSIFGYDPVDGSLYARNFDNLGYARRYELSVDGRRWTYSGEAERAIQDFGPDGKRFRIRWERLVDGKWLSLRELVGHRIG